MSEHAESRLAELARKERYEAIGRWVVLALIAGGCLSGYAAITWLILS